MTATPTAPPWTPDPTDDPAGGGSGLPEHLAPIPDERAVLGAALVSTAALDVLLPAVPTSAIFHDPRHEYAWEAVIACYERGERADALNVRAELARTGTLALAGDAAYLHSLVAGAPLAPEHVVGTYLERVVNAWQLRSGDVALDRARRTIAAQAGATAGDVLDVVTAEIQTARDLATRQRSAFWVGTLVDDVLDGLDPYQFDDSTATIPWPYRDLGQVMNPLTPGQMICVAGRPGTGKSLVLMNCLEAVSFDLGLPTLLISYEMKAAEIAARVMSHQARVPLGNLTRRGALRGEDRAGIADYRDALDAAPLIIVDTEDTSQGEIDRLIRFHKPRLVAIDYLQLAVPEGPPEHRRQAVERYSRATKKMAQRREVPIIIGSQLNRASESRTGHKPLLADLRETGAIEQDCDAVILLYREDLYERESPRAGEVDLIVAKQRNGPTDTVTLAARLHYASFADMAH